nr:MAG TPA: hypothetical protein [Caudoviricetes sp.]
MIATSQMVNSSVLRVKMGTKKTPLAQTSWR